VQSWTPLDEKLMAQSSMAMLLIVAPRMLFCAVKCCIMLYPLAVRLPLENPFWQDSSQSFLLLVACMGHVMPRHVHCLVLLVPKAATSRSVIESGSLLGSWFDPTLTQCFEPVHELSWNIMKYHEIVFGHFGPRRPKLEFLGVLAFRRLYPSSGARIWSEMGLASL